MTADARASLLAGALAARLGPYRADLGEGPGREMALTLAWRFRMTEIGSDAVATTMPLLYVAPISIETGFGTMLDEAAASAVTWIDDNRPSFEDAAIVAHAVFFRGRTPQSVAEFAIAAASLAPAGHSFPDPS